MNVYVTLRGPLFSKNASSVVKNAIVAEALQKIAERIERPGRRAGRKNNQIGRRINTLTLVSSSTLNRPRTSGRSWIRKHVGGAFGKGIIGSMAPAVLRKTAKRIIAELS